jgi:hypothetical protein
MLDGNNSSNFLSLRNYICMNVDSKDLYKCCIQDIKFISMLDANELGKCCF